MPTHAHTMVAGWLMSAVFAFFYHLFPAIGQKTIAVIHFWLMAVSGIALMIALYFELAGHPEIEPVLASSSIGFYAGMLLFAFISLPAIWKKAGASRRSGSEGRCADTAQNGSGRSRNIRSVKGSLSFTGVYYVHPVIWILTEWLEPLRLTPPC